MYHSSSSQHDYQQQQHAYNSNMMPQMHPMYPQGPYHQQQQQQQQQPFYPNQLRPMRFEHQGNYQNPIRHHHVQQNQMMRPMHDNFGMHHPRPINHLANAVTQNIQQRYGTG